MNGAHQRESAIFDAAMELPPEQRAAYLERACGSDVALRRRVEALLKADESRSEFLDSPSDPGLRRSVPFTAFLREKPGDMIGRYKLLQRIGEGGCGVVYMADQAEPVRRRVAFKIIKLGMDTKSVIARFEAERQALAMMDHPNIARVFDAGATETGRPYFVMELVRGMKITDYCDEKKLSTRERLELFIQICQAIQHAHQKGIIHRDIKPSNILVTVNDGVAVPKVIDFGVAKATSGQQLTDKTLFTAFEQFIGTPAYMSPEQAVLTSLDVDTRSDIYALGVLLYELLTGRTPFNSEELMKIGLEEMRRTIREKEPDRPSIRVRTLPGEELSTTALRRDLEPPKLASVLRGDLDWIVMKCLEKDRARRYESASGLAMDLQRHMNNEPVLARPPSRWYEFQKTVRRHMFGFAATAAVIVSLGTGLAVSGWMFLQERAALHRAVTAEERAQDGRDRALAAELEANKQRDRAETFATESHRRLVERFVMEGNRLVEAGDLFSALLPFAMALKEDQDEGSRADIHRLRLSTTLQQCPKLVVACFSDYGLGSVEFSPDGSRFLTVCDYLNEAQVWNAATGSALTPPLQHSGDLRDSGFSPDGQWVVTASYDGTAQIWNASTGERRGSALEHPGPVRSARFSPDNRMVVTTCEDGAARVWDAAAGKQYGKALEHPEAGDMREAEFSSDGRRILVTSRHLARVWTFDEERRNLELSLNLPGMQAVLSPDGDRVLILRGDNAEIWDVATGEKIIGLRAAGNQGESLAVVFSPDGERVATVSKTKNGYLVQISDARTGKLVAPPLTDPQIGPIKALRFSPDGRRLLTAVESQVKIWDVEIGQLAVPPLTHGGPVRSATFSRDGRQVLTSSNDCSARIWDLAGGQPDLPSVQHPALVNKIVFHPDARRVLTISLDGTAVFWDLASAEASPFPSTQPTAVSHADFSRDGRLLALSRTDRTAGVWNLETGQMVGPPMSHQGRVNSIEFSSDGRRVVTAGADGAVRIWRFESGELIAEMSHPGPVNFATFTPDGQRVVSTMVNTPGALQLGPRGPFVWSQEGLIADEAGVRLWDATSGQLMGSPVLFDNSVTEIILSPDRLHAFRVCSNGATPRRLAHSDIWNLSGVAGPVPRLVQDGTLFDGQFSPDGGRVVTGGFDGTARLWDATTGEMLTAPMIGRLSDCTFSPDGRLLATGSVLTPEVRLWDASTGRVIGPPLPVRREGVVNQIAFSPNGEYLVVATSDNHVRALKTGMRKRPLEDDLLLAQMLAGRTLDESDTHQAINAGRLQDAWEALHLRYPEEFGATWEELETLLREEQVELKQVLSDSNRQLYRSVNALADILGRESKWNEAETLYLETLEFWKSSLGADDPDIPGLRYNLGLVYEKAGQLDQALTTFQESLRLMVMHLGTNEDRTRDNILHLAGIYSELSASDQTNEAAESRRKAAALLTHLETQYSDNPDLLAFFYLGGIYSAAERGEGIVFREKLLALQPLDAVTLNWMAWILATSPYPELRDGPNAVAIAAKAVAATDRTNASYLDTLAAAYAEAGQFPDAVRLQQEALSLWGYTDTGFGERLALYQFGIPFREHGLLATNVFRLLDAGQFAEAEPEARTCLALRERLIPDDWSTFHAKSLLGASLLGQKKYAEAAPLLLAGYEGMRDREDQMGALARPRLREALQRLVQLYEATGPPDLATKWRQTLAMFEEAEVLPADSPASTVEP